VFVRVEKGKEYVFNSKQGEGKKKKKKGHKKKKKREKTKKKKKKKNKKKKTKKKRQNRSIYENLGVPFQHSLAVQILNRRFSFALRLPSW